MDLRKFLLTNFNDFTTTESGPKDKPGTVVIYFQNNMIWPIATINVNSTHRIYYKRTVSDIPKTLYPLINQFKGFRIFVSYSDLKDHLKTHYAKHIIQKQIVKRRSSGSCYKVTHAPTGHYYLTRHTLDHINDTAILRDTVGRWKEHIGSTKDSPLVKFVNNHIYDVTHGTNFIIRKIGGFIDEVTLKQLVDETIAIHGTNKFIRDNMNGFFN